MEVYLIFFLQNLQAPSVLLISALRHSTHTFRYCPNTLDESPLFTHRTILSPSFPSQSSEDISMLFSTECVSGQEATGFHQCFAWKAVDLPPTVDVGVWAVFWPERAPALAPCPAAKPVEDGDVCHSPLPSASLETIH